MRYALAALAVGCAWLAASASPAGAATNECRGLEVCVPVAGPWVLVPAGRGVPRAAVEFQLSCPRGYVVGGLDAELSDRRIEIGFAGRLGSPVNPGITTTRAAVFVGRYVGASAAAPSFRPHIGCIPAAGGGGRLPTSLAVVPPGEPTARRVRTVQLRAGQKRRVVQACGRGERLVGAAHALGVLGKKPPAVSVAQSLRATRSLRGGRVTVAADAGAGLGRARAVVQVSAICAGGA